LKALENIADKIATIKPKIEQRSTYADRLQEFETFLSQEFNYPRHNMESTSREGVTSGYTENLNIFEQGSYDNNASLNTFGQGLYGYHPGPSYEHAESNIFEQGSYNNNPELFYEYLNVHTDYTPYEYQSSQSLDDNVE